MKKIITLCFILGLMAGCSAQNTNTVYSAQEIGKAGTIQTGQIIDIQLVQIKGEQGIGTLATTVAGAAAGAMLGGNTAMHVIGGAGGAVAGNLIGGAVEEKITATTAYRFMIKQENGNIISVIQSNESNLKVGDNVYLNQIGDTIRLIRY